MGSDHGRLKADGASAHSHQVVGSDGIEPKKARVPSLFAARGGRGNDGKFGLPPLCPKVADDPYLEPEPDPGDERGRVKCFSPAFR